MEEILSKKVDELFQKWDCIDSPGAAVAIVCGGEVIYKRGYGYSNLEYDIPITEATVFHVASISKQFTAAAILLLSLEGKLSMEDDIRKYLNYVPNFGHVITIAHLVHHLSGLRDQWELNWLSGYGMDDVITQKNIIEMVKHQKKLNFIPGDESQYCNTGYTLLAEIVKEVAGKNLHEYLEEKVFRPLNMANTHFHYDNSKIVKNRAYSYAPGETAGFQKAVLNYSNMGATSLFTTVEDLASWMLNFENSVVGGVDFMEKMACSGILNNGESANYGFGLGIRKYKGLIQLEHGGFDAGYRSCFYYFPENKFGVIVLSNAGNFDAHQVSKQITDMFLKEYIQKGECISESPNPEETKPNNDKKPYNKLSSEELMELEGDYLSKELCVTYKIIIEEDKLKLVQRRVEDRFFVQIDEDVFRRENNGTEKIKILREASRAVVGFEFNGYSVRRLEFHRMSPDKISG